MVGSGQEGLRVRREEGLGLKRNEGHETEGSTHVALGKMRLKDCETDVGALHL